MNPKTFSSFWVFWWKIIHWHKSGWSPPFCMIKVSVFSFSPDFIGINDCSFLHPDRRRRRRREEEEEESAAPENQARLHTQETVLQILQILGLFLRNWFSDYKFWVVQIPNHFLLNNSENFGFVLWRIEFREISAFCKNSEPLLFCEQFCKFCKCWVCLWSIWILRNKFWVLQILNLFFVHGQFCKFCKCWVCVLWKNEILNLSLFVLWAIL